MANAFVGAVQEPIGLIARGQRAVDEAGAAMTQSQTLRAAPESDRWLQTIEQSSGYVTRLQSARQRLNQVAQDHTAFSGGGVVRELFLSAGSGGMAEFVASLGAGPALSDLDRATVYRNLLSLTEAGLLVKTRLGDNVWRFGLLNVQSREHGTHPHFVCTDCGGVVCLPESAVTLRGEAVRNQVAEVQLRGRCVACQRA